MLYRSAAGPSPAGPSGDAHVRTHALGAQVVVYEVQKENSTEVLVVVLTQGGA